ncbi:hypothetical protein HF521_018046 [Silurus meridionalis]|uniref:Enkurin domain-containing protein n=1 Tax=Silurus meridionalis TaxID=175797 RepID=A0A8T0BPG5_SILME|nr:hypothetical protein HF521_018046 [Silurus meridionalis]
MKATISSVMHPPENFYHLIPREEVKSEKAPRYMSQFREQVKQEQKLNKASHRTMGPAKVEVSSPDKFLKKHSKEPKLPEKKPFSYREVLPRKPSIPAKTEQLLAGGHAQRDFVRRNAVENIKAVPRKPEPASVHTRHGDKELLENSGLVPKYIKRKDYGKVPEYLKQRQEELRRAQEEYDRYVKKKRKEEAMMQLSEEERQDILHSLTPRCSLSTPALSVPEPPPAAAPPLASESMTSR